MMQLERAKIGLTPIPLATGDTHEQWDAINGVGRTAAELHLATVAGVASGLAHF